MSSVISWPDPYHGRKNRVEALVDTRESDDVGDTPVSWGKEVED